MKKSIESGAGTTYFTHDPSDTFQAWHTTYSVNNFWMSDKWNIFYIKVEFTEIKFGVAKLFSEIYEYIISQQ